jgi:hypothetical protein
VVDILIWLERNPLSVLIREHPSLFGFPFVLFLHTLGLAMLAGISVAIDLWLLRTGAIARSARMTGLLSAMWLGLGINTLSGVALLLAYPAKALTNGVFYLKLVLVVLAVYAAARINRAMFPGGHAAAGTIVTPAVKRWAVASLALWTGTVLTGRLLAYTHRVLFAYELA